MSIRRRNHTTRRPWAAFASTLALGLSLFALTACEEGLVGGGGDDLLTISELEITAADTVLAEGATSHFQAQARTSADVAVDTATITWASRDESVATVGASTGTVTAVMHGETYIVAETGSGDARHTDSVLVTVSLPEVNSVGQAEFRIRGDVTASHSWQSSDEMYLVGEEDLGPNQEDVTWLEVEHEVDNGDDFGFFAIFPGTTDFTAGSIELVAWDPTTLEDEENIEDMLDGAVALFFQEEDDHDLIYANTGGTITIESISGQVGHGEGQAVEAILSVNMTAEEYRWDYDSEDITATGKTVEIRGRMGAAYFKSYRGYATMTLTGEVNLDVEANWMDAYTASDGLWLYSDWYENLSDDRYANLWFETHVATPGTGTFTVDSIGPWEGTSDMDFVSGYYSIYDEAVSNYEVDLYMMSHSGTIDIDQYSETSGIVEGTTTVTLGVLDFETSEYTGEVQAEIYFIAPLYTDSEWTTAAMKDEARDRSGFRDLLRDQQVPERRERRQ